VEDLAAMAAALQGLVPGGGTAQPGQASGDAPERNGRWKAQARAEGLR
jgi:hypothetical protein